MKTLVAVILAALVLGWLCEQALDALLLTPASPCNATWDNGVALDAEDCAYMGGGGWQ